MRDGSVVACARRSAAPIGCTSRRRCSPISPAITSISIATWKSYFVAKRRLAELLPETGIAVTNLDDPRGRDFAAAARRPVTYAIDAAADVRPGPLAFSLEGLRFEVRTPRGTLRLVSSLVGRPNVYNILAAAATAMALDVPFGAIEKGHRRS